MSEYVYDPLPGPRYIRVLQAAIDVEDSDAELWLSMKIIDLDSPERLDYACLSYTWGDPFITINDDSSAPPSEECMIFCDNTPFMVAENLYQALLRLFRPPTSRWYWVDAICINQDDIQERGQQVAIMSSIYAKASFVLVWLGPEDEHASVAVPLLEKISAAIRKVPSKDKMITLAAALPFNHAQVWTALGIPTLTVCQWKSLSEFFSRTWFSRMWILQEAVLCQLVGVYCGNLKFSLTSACEVAELVVLAGYARAIASITGNRHAAYSAAFEIGSTVNIIQKGLHYPKQRELHERFFGARSDAEHLASFCGWIWTSNRQRGASDPRDKIYAPLALAKRLQGDIVLQFPVPDYTKSTVQVFTQAAKFLLSETRSLSLLSYVEDKAYRNISGLPTWVPDFTKMEVPISINRMLAQFDASCGWEYDRAVPQDLSSALLPLTGACLDSIEHIFPIFPFSQSLSIARLPFVKYDKYPASTTTLSLFLRTLLTDTLHDIHRPLTDPPVPYNDVRNAFISIVMFEILYNTIGKDDADTFSTNEQILDIALRIFSGYLMVMGTFGLRLDDVIGFCSSLARVWRTTQPESTEQRRQRLTSGLIIFQQLSDLKISNRYLVVTRNRGLLGMTCQSVRPGDEVWIFRGGKVPYVVRPVDGGVASGSEAKVDGLKTRDMPIRSSEGVQKATDSGERSVVVTVGAKSEEDRPVIFEQTRQNLLATRAQDLSDQDSLQETQAEMSGQQVTHGSDLRSGNGPSTTTTTKVPEPVPATNPTVSTASTGQNHVNEANDCNDERCDGASPSNMYEYVGEAYFYGFMHGEAIKLFEREGKIEEKIVLR